MQFPKSQFAKYVFGGAVFGVLWTTILWILREIGFRGWFGNVADALFEITNLPILWLAYGYRVAEEDRGWFGHLMYSPEYGEYALYVLMYVWNIVEFALLGAGIYLIVRGIQKLKDFFGK